MSADAVDLVVVGGGPRALSALIALDDALASGPPAAVLRVLLCDPELPGAGAVWAPEQPPHLVMNLDPTSVDFSSRSGLVPDDYRAWEAASGIVAEPYPPRSRVGMYLAWAYECLVRSPRLDVTHVAGRMEALSREGDVWAARVAGREMTTCEVLLCTGHAGGAGVDHAAVAADVVSYPAGAPVAVRGAALTGMDVVLGLTAGRGGAWSPDGYVPGGPEPSVIILVSRSGELMMPKPERRDPATAAAVEAVVTRWRPGAVPDDAWWDVLLDAAVAGAAESGVRLSRPAAAQALDSGRPPADWRGRLRDDLARALGDVDDDPAWWLGRAWAAGYAPMIRSLERGPRPAALWRRWRGRAARLERWAFGPPAQTVGRLLALADAGLLDVSTTMPAGVPVVDAVTCGPGVLDVPGGTAHDDLWAGLLADGHVVVRAGERGVWTLPDGRCVSAHGPPSPGLSALGRPTEDPVIGHDTLLRTLHQDVERWASRLAQQQTEQQAREHRAPMMEESAR